jgi:hypothetical protein
MRKEYLHLKYLRLTNLEDSEQVLDFLIKMREMEFLHQLPVNTQKVKWVMIELLCIRGNNIVHNCELWIVRLKTAICI